MNLKAPDEVHMTKKLMFDYEKANQCFLGVIEDLLRMILNYTSDRNAVGLTVILFRGWSSEWKKSHPEGQPSLRTKRLKRRMQHFCGTTPTSQKRAFFNEKRQCHTLSPRVVRVWQIA
jgi:hypothetical protein